MAILLCTKLFDELLYRRESNRPNSKRTLQPATLRNHPATLRNHPATLRNHPATLRSYSATLCNLLILYMHGNYIPATSTKHLYTSSYIVPTSTIWNTHPSCVLSHRPLLLHHLHSAIHLPPFKPTDSLQ